MPLTKQSRVSEPRQGAKFLTGPVTVRRRETTLPT